jgi:acyl dehydratase
MSGNMHLTPGAELPPIVGRTGFEHWNRYAAVNDEFVPIHMDDAAGREAGFASAIGMGNLIWSYFHRLLRDGLGGRIEKISARYHQPNLRDSMLTVRAKVAEVANDADATRVTVELAAEDDAGRTLVTGRATVAVARQV